MKIAVGLSGGVDSAVAAMLLSKQGHEVVGITMKLWRGQYAGGSRAACFGPQEAESLASAAKLAKLLGIEHRVFDVSKEYDETIVKYFRETYLNGETPNPCVRCNAIMKFGLLPRLAAEAGLEFDHYATGHYARVIERDGRMALLRAVDEVKDQSYFLYRLSQEQLRRQLFPLGALTKGEVREIAREAGLPIADRPDSQDFYSGDVGELVGAPDRAGEIVDLTGKVLGTHRGFWHYTIGQRRGLGLGGGGIPYYVIELNACANRVVVGRADEALGETFRVTDLCWVSQLQPTAALPCRVKVRSAGKLVPAIYENGVCHLERAIAGIAPGQSAVFYEREGEAVIGGGIIVGEKADETGRN